MRIAIELKENSRGKKFCHEYCLGLASTRCSIFDAGLKTDINFPAVQFVRCQACLDAEVAA